MPRNLSSRRGLRLLFLFAGIMGYPLGGWPAIAVRSPDQSPSEKIALRFPDLSPPQDSAAGLPGPSTPQIPVSRLSDRSPSQIVGLRFPELTPTQIVALRFPESSTVGLRPSPKSAAATAAVAPEQLLHLINFQVAAALPPIGYSRFCLRYPDDCKVRAIDFRHRKIVLTAERWSELNEVNRDVNKSIFAVVTPGNGLTEEWAISPSSGDCKDYAVTKRHELLARGWPSRALLLSEVALSSGEHHLVVTVRVKGADLVLDNLHDDIRPVAMTYDQYVWVRIQSPQNPKFWMRVQRSDVVRTAMLSN
jgi:predicted transglutaminase-like cysteine proteinase